MPELAEPEIQDVNSAADTSTAAPTDTAAPADTSSDAKAAEQPTRTTLDVIREAAEGDHARSSSARGTDTGSNDPKSNTTEKPGAAQADTAGNAQDEASVPFHKHPRWQEVNRQLREYRKKTAELEPLADGYRKLEERRNQLGLKDKDIADALELQALMAVAPEKALEKLNEYSAALQKKLGLAIPDDIRDRVDGGLIDEDSAKELSKARATAAAAAEERQTAQRQAIQDTANQWWQTREANDPDFGLMKDMVQDRLRVLVQANGPATSPRAAVALLEQATKDVAERLRPLRPAKQDTPKTLQPGTAAPVAPQPKSTLEAMQMALR